MKLLLIISIIILLIWSYIEPYDYFTWYLETAPLFIALPILILTHKKFIFSNFAYLAIWFQMIILAIGAHYTYALVPLFDYLGELFNCQRNHFDRLGHLFQGITPAIVARELLLRKSPLANSKWLNPLIILSITGISAIYELLEWIVAEFTSEKADSFLGTQGDIWDTQKDISLALIGACISVYLLNRIHDKSIKSL